MAISPTISLADVTVLIVPPVDPAHPMSDQQVRAVSDYLDRGGHVLLMGDPEAAPLPARPAHEVRADRISRRDPGKRPEQRSGSPTPFNLIVTSYGSSTITKDMGSLRTFYSAVEAIQPPTSTITGFVSTAVRAEQQHLLLAKIVPDERAAGHCVPDEPPRPGPLTMIVSVEQDVPAATGTVTDTYRPDPDQGNPAGRDRRPGLRLRPAGAAVERDDQPGPVHQHRRLAVQSEDRISIPAPSTGPNSHPGGGGTKPDLLHQRAWSCRCLSF